MKKIFTLVFISFLQTILAQNTTTPTGSSTEVGETAGQLSVSLSGAATYNIPIEVPPGLNGVVPQLSLNYSSQSGNGIAGYGWNIGGLSAITRIPSTKFHDGTNDPVDFDALDRFALDGQRLIVKAGTTGVYGANNTVYETENFSNVKITSFGVHPSGANYGPAWFKVEYPDGSVAEYGNGTGVVARSLTSWAIKKWQNPQAVNIIYDYTLTNNILEIDKIHYGSITETTHMNHIEFIYKTRQRSEQFYIAGHNFENSKILSLINVTGLRKYLLTHEITPTKYEKLISVTEQNADETLSLNPTVFEYGSLTNIDDNLKDIALNESNANTYGSNHHYSISGNFNGDNVADYIILPYNHSFNELHIGGINALDQNACPTISNTIQTVKKAFITTMLGYGDVVIPNNGWTFVKKTSAGNNCSYDFFNYYFNMQNNTVIHQHTKNITFTNENNQCNIMTNPKIDFYPGDFNGDSFTDVISVNNGKVYFTNLNNNVQSNYNFFLGNVAAIYNRIEVIDYNGDGQSDLMVFDNNTAYVYTKSKTSNTLVTLTGIAISTLKSYFNPVTTTYDLHFGDFNGDGKTDFATQATLQDVDFWVFYISNETYWDAKIGTIGENYSSNNNVQSIEQIGCYPCGELSSPIHWSDHARTINLKYFKIADFNGDGKSDILVDKHKVWIKKIRVNGSGTTINEDESYNGKTFSHILELRSNNNFSNNSFNFVHTATKNTAYSCPTASFPPENTVVCNYSDDGYNQFWDLQVIDAMGNLTIIKNHNIKSYNFKKNKDEMLLTKVTKASGITENIYYNTFNKNNPYNSVFPKIDLSPANRLAVVSELKKITKNHKTKQIFKYFDPVVDTDGLGFLGFKESYRSEFFNDITWVDYSKVKFTYFKNDQNLRGANIEVWQMLDIPSEYNMNIVPNFISKSINTYNTATNALQTNKVFKLKNTKTETWNNLDNTSSETTSVLDVYNNPTLTTTHVKNGTIIEKTTTNTIVYDNQPSAITFVIGRPTSKIVNTKIYPGQANEDIAINEEQYAYTNHLLTQIKKKATNSGLTTGFLTEDNIFDAFGNITRKTITALGETPRVTNFEYSTTYGSRFLTKSIDVELLETNYTYDAVTGLLKTELLPSISENFPLFTSYTYDTWGKKTSVTNYLKKAIQYSYTRDEEKTQITATSDDGSATFEIFDDLGRIIKTGTKTIDNNVAYTETEYDNFDRAIKTSEPFFDGATKLWNETTFDNYGRPLTIKAATGKIANYTYPDFLTTNVNDGTLNKTNVKNALGNVISLIDTPGGTITYNYFANGNLKKTVYSGQETIISQDGWGRKTKLIEPSAGEYNYTYNGFGQALTESTPNGTTAYAYTDIGKLNTKTVKGKPSTDGTFSGTNILSTYAYLPNKMLEKITVTNPNDGNSFYTYAYDDFKRILYTKEEFTTIAPRKFENNLEYDEYGRILSEISTATINGFVSAKTIFNEYKNGELFKKRENDATGKPIWTLNTRNARGQITSATLGDNLIAHTNTYHALGHTLTTNYNKVATPTVSIMTLTNTYDYVQGNMLTRSNSLFAWNETFTYDSLDRLTGFTDKNGAQTTQDYEENGKIKSNFLGLYRYSTAKPYQNTTIKLSTAGQQEAGLMTQQTIVYSAFKAPISITQGAQKAFFGYNFAQDRSVMYFGNSNTNKLLQPKRRFYSADGTMQITMTLATSTKGEEIEFTTYIGGDAYSAPALARQTNNASSSIFYLHRDHLGTILAITNNLAVVVEKRLFDAWGDIIKVKDDKGNDLAKLTFIDRGYTGHEHLQSFRLINMNGRLYDPKLHRFLQPDNNLQEPYNTQNYNRYAYVLNNPLKYTDPDGEWFLGTIITAITNGIQNVIKHGVNFDQYNWKELNNAWKIDTGMFKGNFGQILNNLTWGLVTNTVGNLVAHGYNLAGQVDGVTHLAGATAIETKGSGNPFTVGSYITGPKGFKADWKDHLFVHEYGHYIQSQWFGPLYIPIVAVSSVASVAGLGGDDHGSRWFEVQASRMGGKYFDERYGSGASGYVQGSRDYFDYDAFGRGGLTAYTNERRNSRDQGRGHQTSGARFSVWDIIAPVFPIPTLTLSLFTKKKK